MSIEATLTRELEIRFIDAKTITNQAKIAIGITGYPSQEQKELLIAESIKIFKSQPSDKRAAMRQMKEEFDDIKVGSSRSFTTATSGSSNTGSDDQSSSQFPLDSPSVPGSTKSASARRRMSNLLSMGRRKNEPN